ncbi:aldehyde dehydrogenase family protein [Planococcus lenghuensis]|uniref:3-sulfolactaldehyde dehydrogenase n=1 Tax=Planococcus lenghuensis TaxID=2213202 RepID=A0A1Q2KY69_9BACL|nr:aldehyde dehydrogenase family protein [Planococcus lenghuensis]AQQ53158.1 aldehyde dehydrogenase [Planococcus lenghuensis]
MLIGSIINGSERNEQDRETHEVRNPFNQELIGTIALASPEDLDDAVNSAYEIYEKTIRHMPAHKRGEILRKAAQLLDERKEEFAQSIMIESGKPIQQSRTEVQRSVQLLLYAAEEAKNITGEVVPMDAAIGGENRMGMVKKKSLGVVGAITPFNFPLNLTLHKIAPAIAAGNTVVFKPAEKTPITGYKIVKLLHESGLPEAALNLVLGTGADIGQPLVEHEKVAKISFTGSVPVGKGIQKSAGFKKLTLELGSNSPILVFDDANIEDLAVSLIKGGFGYSGQTCISVQRIYAHTNIYEQLLEKLIEETNKLKVGDPADESVDIGPMITEEAAKRADEWIKKAVEEGAKAEVGGERNGNIVPPTILTNVNKEMHVVKKEVFAPIISVIPFEQEEDAIAQANDSIYGLQAAVFTKNIDRAFRVADQIESGGVWINESSTYRQDNYPYGGVKQSGVGREGVKYAVEEMLELKFIGVKLER